MHEVFADTGYWVAIANSRDGLHRRATALAEQFAESRIVTSEMVLVEVLNGFAECGAYLRGKAVALVHLLFENPVIDVVVHTPIHFRDALELYRGRPDKDCSLTDCASFLIMERRQITEALTHDRHFEQRGYRALLRA